LYCYFVSFAATTLCIASQRMVSVVVYFVIDSARKLLDTHSDFISQQFYYYYEDKFIIWWHRTLLLQYKRHPITMVSTCDQNVGHSASVWPNLLPPLCQLLLFSSVMSGSFLLIHIQVSCNVQSNIQVLSNKCCVFNITFLSAMLQHVVIFVWKPFFPT